MRRYVAIVRGHLCGTPLAMYDGTEFVRFDSTRPGELVPGKGRCFDCVFQGRAVRIWQMYAVDRWYVEE